MCASASWRCGSCLAKYNGSSWEESYKCVLLVRSWTLVLNKNFQLCIDGRCDFAGGVTVCLPITDRLNSYWIISESNLVKLQGVLNTKKLPDFVAKKFSQGFPSNWRYVASRWGEYLQSGERSLFSWEQDDSFFSSDTSILMTRRQRRTSSGRDTSTTSKDSSQPDLAKEPEKDSAVPSSHSSSNQNARSKPGSYGVSSPWLPAHKLKAINQWIDGAHIPTVPEPHLDMDSENRRLLAVPVESASCAVTSRNRAQRTDAGTQSSECEIPLSTPQGSERNSRLRRELEMWNVSNINSELSEVDDSFVGKLFPNRNEAAAPPLPRRGRTTKSSINVPLKGPQLVTSSSNKSGSVKNSEAGHQRPSGDVPSENVFRIPKDFSKNSVPKSSVKSDPKKPDSLRQTTNKNSEVPGSHMGRMLSSSHRPRRRQQIQRIERWRPVIGVDGLLKVQGYLLLANDMTAGQILTTNSVVDWGERKVETCDGRAYELVGEPNGRIPDDLRPQLFSAMNCEDIVSRLSETQALRDRTDWGAEYEFFYGNNSTLKSKSPDSTRLQKSSNSKATLVKEKSKTESKVVNSRDQSQTQEVDSPVIRSSRSERNIASSLRASSQQKSGTSKTSILQQEQNSSDSDLSSPIRRSSRIPERKSSSRSQEKEHSNKGPSSSAINLPRPLLSPSSRIKHAAGSSYKDKHLQNAENDNSKTSSADLKRSCFENVTFKVSQNQMMLPSPRLTRESSNVDFSSSRIKVSYLDPTPKSAQRAVRSLADSSPEKVQQTIDSSSTSNEGTPNSRPSRSAVRRSLFLCCEDSLSSPSSMNHSPYRPHVTVQRSPLALRTRMNTWAASSSMQKTSVTRVLRNRKNIINYKETLLSSPEEVNYSPRGKRGSTQHSSVPSRTKAWVDSSPDRYTRSLRSLEERRSTSAPTVCSPSKPKTAKEKSCIPGADAGRSPPASSGKVPAAGTRKKPAARSGKTSTGIAEKSAVGTKNTRAAIAEKTPAKNKKMGSPRSSLRRSARRKGSQLRVMVQRLDENLPKRRPSTSRVSPKKNKRAAPQKSLNKESDKEPTEGISKENTRVQKKKLTTAKKAPSNTKEVPTKQKKERHIISSGVSSDENDDAVSECSNATDMSVGPSASLIFALDDSPANRRAPRTLRERRKKDEMIAEMGKRLAAKEAVIDNDDDPMAHLLAAGTYGSFPAEWCKHENFFNQNRKRRRPSSSDGTVSPSRSGFEDAFGTEDATSSVATPQLLMKPPDPKQVQSYLQRQRAWNAKPQRPKRQAKNDKDLDLPNMDYAAVFRDDPSDSEASSVSNWDED